MAIKIRLREIREKKGLSQTKLAQKIDMTPQNLQIIEHEKSKSMTYETINRLCNVLECTPNDLIEFTPDSRAS